MLITAVFAAAAACFSGPATYEDRLVDIAVGQGIPREVYRVVDDSPVLKALLLDSAGDRDLSFKMLLAVEKYDKDGRRVLEEYGADPVFQGQLRNYGENIVPVVAYFMNNDIASLRLAYKATRLAEFVKTGRKWLPWGRTNLDGKEKPPAPYSAETRGLHAIERIESDRQNFLGQFAIDAKGVVHWNQTERVLESVESLLFGGVRDLEHKHDLGTKLSLSDYLWAGADVLTVASAAKALKFLKAARGSAKTVEGAGILDRTKLLGSRVLLNDKVGKYVVALGARVGTAYLVVTHPGLLTSLFAEVGEWLGLPPWIAVAFGWWMVALALAPVLLPLLSGLVVLIPAVAGIARVASWLQPRRSLETQATH